MPNVAGLDLEAAGVDHDTNVGIRVDDFLQTSNLAGMTGVVAPRSIVVFVKVHVKERTVDGELAAERWTGMRAVRIAISSSVV